MTVHWLSVPWRCCATLRKAAAMGKKLEVAVAIGVSPLAGHGGRHPPSRCN